MPVFVENDGALLGFRPDSTPFCDYDLEVWSELPRYGGSLGVRLQLDVFGDHYAIPDIAAIMAAWSRIASRAAILEGDQGNREAALEQWSYRLLEEYEAGKRGDDLTAWFWPMLTEITREIYGEPC